MNSTRKHVAQVLMVRADASAWTNPMYQEALFRLVDEGIGGIGVFLGGLDETAIMIQELQHRANNQLLIAADYEYGLPMRLSGGIAFPRAMALGQTLPGITEHVAACIAQEASALGVHVNWAPVADVNNNPSNPIINTRSFGSTPELVAEHAAAFVRGTQSQGVLACAKHAPGHGNTTVDSHSEMPCITDPYPSLQALEHLPFKACIENDVAMVMVAHIEVLSVEPGVPASMSAATIQKTIREEWGFGGLISTDALDMHSITSRYSSAEAVVQAIWAGNDIALMPEHPIEALDALEYEYMNNPEFASKLDAAVARIAAGKLRAGVGASKPQVSVDQQQHAMIALKAATAALRMQGNAELLPILKHKQIAAFAIIHDGDEDAATTWFHYLAQATEIDIDFAFLNTSIGTEDLQAMVHGVANATLVVIALFGKAVAFGNGIGDRSRLSEIIPELSAERPTIVVVCGSPYGLQNVHASLIIHAFSETVPSLAASVLRLVGREPQA